MRAAVLPPYIVRTKTLLLEALRLARVHGRMRVRQRETHEGRSHVITIEIPEPESKSARDRKRDGLRQRG